MKNSSGNKMENIETDEEIKIKVKIKIKIT